MSFLTLTDAKKRTSSPRYKSRRSRSPSPTKKRSSSGNNTSSTSSSSSRRRRTSRAKAKRSPTSPGQGLSSHKQQPPAKRKSSGKHSSARTSAKSGGAHPLLLKQPTSTAPLDSIDIIPIPGPSANRFLPPAPVRISPNDSHRPGRPSGGKSRDLSHDHHQEAAGELKLHIGEGTSQKHDTASSSRSSSSSSIHPLMDLNFTSRQIPREQSLFTSSVSSGIPIASGSKSNATSPSTDSFVLDFKTSQSKSPDFVPLRLSPAPRDTATPVSLSQPEKSALPFSSFFQTSSPRPAVGVSDSYLKNGPRSSPSTKKIAVRSLESLDTPSQYIDTDSDNEGGLVIDESFVSQNGSEASPEKDKSSLEHKIETPSTLVGSLSSSMTSLSDMKPPSSPDCEIINVDTVDSVSSLSSQLKAVSGSDREHCATPELITGSNELSKSSILPLIGARQVKTPSGTDSDHRANTPDSIASRDSSKSSVLAHMSARHHNTMPATKRARKLASTVINAKLVKKLVEGDEMEQDLLRRFFKAVVLVTEHLKWNYKGKPAASTFLSYYKKIFHGFVTGTLVQRENAPADIFKNELKALHVKCGQNISKWKEHLQCYILRASTLPKNKGDMENFMNKRTLMENVKAKSPVVSLDTPDSDTDRPINPRKAKPLPLTPPIATIQHQAHSSFDWDKPTDPRKVKPLSQPLPTKPVRSAFTPVINTSSPSTIKSLPSSVPEDSITRKLASPKKPVTLLTDQSATQVHLGEHCPDSYMFKPLSTESEHDQKDYSLFGVDHSADYSLDSELDRAPIGFISGSSSFMPSNEALVVIDLVGDDLQDSCLPQPTGSGIADEEQSLAGEKVSMDIVLSSTKEDNGDTARVVSQPEPAMVNVESKIKKAVADVISGGDSGVKDDLGSIESSNKLDAPSEPRASSVDLTTASESCDSSKEDGEIISSSPSPAPSPPPEKGTISPVVPMAYGDPERWRRFDSRERELSRQRRRHVSHQSSRSHSRSPSPGGQRREFSPKRFLSRRRRRYRSRSRSWSRNRGSRSHDRRRRSMSRDHRSRSHDRRSRDGRYHSSRMRSRSPQSPVQRLRDQKSHVSDKSQRRTSRSDREKDGKGSTDSEDELEVLKREALASMKQTLAEHTDGDQSVKSSAHEELSTEVKFNDQRKSDMELCSQSSGEEGTREEQLRDGVEIDDYREKDMELCSQSSGEEGERGEEGEADMELCSESSGEGYTKGVSTNKDRETGKMEKGCESSKGNILGDKEDSVVDGRSMVEVSLGDLGDAAIVESNAGSSQQTDKLVLSKEDVQRDYDVTARQDESSPPDNTLQSQEEKTDDHSLTSQHVGPTSPGQAPVARSVSAPSSSLGGKSPAHTVGPPMILPSPTTDKQSMARTQSFSKSPSATTQPSATKNNRPSAIATKTSKVPTNVAATVKTTQPSLIKASTSKTGQPSASKTTTAPLATNSQQTVATTKAKQLSAANVKISQTPSVKAAQASVKTTQAQSVKTSQALSSKAVQGKASQVSSVQKASQAVTAKTNQGQSLKAVQSTAASVAKTSTAVKSLKKSLSCSSSRSGSKANSPCLSPTHTPSPGPSGINDSVGMGGASSSDVRMRQRSESCVKVCTLYTVTYKMHFLVN